MSSETCKQGFIDWRIEIIKWLLLGREKKDVVCDFKRPNQVHLLETVDITILLCISENFLTHGAIQIEIFDFMKK